MRSALAATLSVALSVALAPHGGFAPRASLCRTSTATSCSAAKRPLFAPAVPLGTNVQPFPHKRIRT